MNRQNFDNLDAEERDICIFLVSCDGQYASKAEIIRRAGGRRKFEDDPNWASHALARLTENGTIQSDARGHFRLGYAPYREPAFAPPEPKKWHCTGRQILIVDFDAEWRAVVSSFFEEAGGGVQCATDPIDGMVQTAAGTLDLVILDMNLNIEGGLELIKLLKLYQPGARVILCTRQGHDTEFILAMINQGPVHYVRKGNLEQLKRAAQAALQG